MHIRTHNALAVLVAVLGLVSAACSGPEVLPDEPVTAIPKACKPDDMQGRLSPFLIDEASAGLRQDLEAVLLTRGIAIISASCQGVEVLEGCTVEGEYSFVNLSTQDKTLIMKDKAQAAANLGFGVGGGLEAAFSAGRELILQYRLIGKYKTTVPGVVRGQLQSATCTGATHFVTSVDVGAFSSFAASRGAFSSSAKIGGQGGDASGETETSNKVSAGNFDACASKEEEAPKEFQSGDAPADGEAPAEGEAPAPVAKPNPDKTPSPGCGASIRVSLSPIIEVETLSDFGLNRGLADSEEDCRPGFVLNNNELCVPREDAAVYLCNASDYDECRLMCLGPEDQKEYNLQSCGRVATLLTQHILEAYEDREITQKRCKRNRDCGDDEVCNDKGFCTEEDDVGTNRFLVLTNTINKKNPFIFREVNAFGPRLIESCETQSEGDACALAAVFKLIQFDAEEEEEEASEDSSEDNPEETPTEGDPSATAETDATPEEPAEEVDEEAKMLKQMTDFYGLVHKGCHAGDQFSCEVIEIVLLALAEDWAPALEAYGVKDTDAAYLDALQASCDQGNSQMCLSLARLYTTGERVGEPDKALAIKYAKRSCNGGLPPGCVLSAGLQFNNAAICHEALGSYQESREDAEPLGIMTDLASFDEDFAQTICGDADGAPFVPDTSLFLADDFIKSFRALRTGCSYADAESCRLSARVYQAVTLKKSDQCPDEAEDFDGFLDLDGCPDLDNDQDGIPDELDKCPDKAETLNGRNDEDGCPEVALTGSQIVLGEQIFFARSKDRVLAKSAGVLDDVAEILKSNPRIRVRIEGHTDDVGNDAKNKKLSQQRAESVKQELVDRGVNASRMTAIGYGEERPKVPIKGIKARNLRKARDENRRVEFQFVN